MQAQSIPARMRSHLIGGGFGALCFALLLLVFDTAGLRALLLAEPTALPIFIISSIFAFAPMPIASLWLVFDSDE